MDFFLTYLLSSVVHRFLFILLGPLGKGPQYHEIGRSIATLMTDEVRPKHSIIKVHILAVYDDAGYHSNEDF